MMYYVCKYTPLELFAGFSAPVRPLDQLPENIETADRVAPANLCGFSRALIEQAEESNVRELVLTNCCDSMRRAYDILKEKGNLDFIYLLDFPRTDEACQVERFAESLWKLKDAYAAYSGKTFEKEVFLASFTRRELPDEPYVGIFGVRVGPELEKEIRDCVRRRTVNLTCLGGRDLSSDLEAMAAADDEEQLFLLYAQALLSQMPCFRMDNHRNRERIFLDQNLAGIIYHTIQFCDFYGFEYAGIKNSINVPLLKIETDYTRQSLGQLQTRLQAFAETIGAVQDAGGEITEEVKNRMQNQDYYSAGIDSGSTSTDVVILDQKKEIVSSVILPTGGGAGISAEKSLQQALSIAGIDREKVLQIVTTGYGRAYLNEGDDSVTEITCHARGAHFLHPIVRTIIDIGGQDSKVIRIDENGNVTNFLMNDKCAAGTGRFLEMMARTLDLSIEEMAREGLEWKEDVSISSMCTVFAESEVVSLVAQNKAVPDIIHGLNCSIASRVGALAARLGPEDGAPVISTDREHATLMMTGGVAKNEGIVRALEENLHRPIHISDKAQLCGALGAALFAMERLQKE
jgi:predicted CoA-substrate-specific enzyme activase